MMGEGSKRREGRSEGRGGQWSKDARIHMVHIEGFTMRGKAKKG